MTYRRAWFLAALSVFVVAPVLGEPLVAQLQQPQELPGMDWPANGAWRAKARRVREHRRALLRAGDVDRLNGGRRLFAAAGASQLAGAATTVAGTFNVPVIPIAFSDLGLPFPKGDYEAALFGTTPPVGRGHTLRTYYQEASGGLLELSGQVFDPVVAPNTAAFYENNCHGYQNCSDGGARFGNLLLLALETISNRPGGATVWSNFDNDGPDGIPNSGDDDGDVDFVAFIQPRVDGSCSGSPGIWAHRWVMSGWNANSKYVTKTPRKNAAGQPIPGQFIQIDSYVIQSAVGGATACLAGTLMPPGIMIHETGHAFGLPDLYDTNLGGNGGIGEWSVMSTGNWMRPFSPAGFDAWSLMELGWVAVDTLSGTRTVTTRARPVSDTVFIARMGDTDEYLVVENRQAVQTDTALFDPTANAAANCTGTCRKQPGLLLYHLDLSVIDGGREDNRVNVGANPGVRIVEADGLRNIVSNTNGRNRGDAGDTYPGKTNNTRWAVTSMPASVTRGNAFAGFIVDRIEQLANGAMRFRFIRREPSVFTAAAGTKISINGLATASYREVIAAGDQVALTTEEFYPIAAGTRNRWLSWSHGGTRTQTLTSGAKPDTISTTYGLEHQVKLMRTGTAPGELTVNPTGTLLDGFFVAANTPVTLKASAPPGVTFEGWKGDTTATDSTLVLPMAKPYNLQAGFSGEIITVLAADATTDLLGTAKLSALEKIALDYLGNKNGRYDLGDLLALLKRNGAAIPPELLEAAAKGTLGKAAK